ncbi:O-antigen ligase family protein [Patescibacteria group bacterium]|nr:O-antigen ligase family protein [Patescibacteria group bacterium]
MNLEKIRNYLLLIPAILPLVFTSFTFQPWHFGKTILFVILVDIIVVLVVIDFLRRKELEIRSFDRLDISISILFGIFLLSSIFAFDVERAFFGTMVRANGFIILIHFYIYYLLLRQFFVIQDWIRIFRIIAVVGFLSIIIAWLGPMIPLFEGIVVGGYSRLNGIFGNSIFLASYLWSFILLICLAIFKDKYSKNWQYFYYLNLIFSVPTIFASGSRGAVLAFFVALLFLFIGCILLFKNKKIKTVGIAALLIMVSIVAYLYSPWGSTVRQHLPATIAQIFNLSVDSLGANTRLMAWDIAWQGFLNRPIMGWGLSNFQHTFDKFYNPDFLDYGLGETVWDIPHNEFLEVMVSGGIFAMLSVLFIIILVFKRIYTLIFKENKFLFILMVSVGVAYIIQAMFVAETSNTLWGLTILLAGLQYGQGEKKEFRKNVYKNFLGAILLCLAVLSLFWSCSTLKMSNNLLAVRNYAETGEIVKWQSQAKNALEYKGSYDWEQSIHVSVDLLKFDRSLRSVVDLSEITDDLILVLEDKNNSLGDNYLINFWLARLYGDKGEYGAGNIYFEKALEHLEKAKTFNNDHQYVVFLESRYLLSLQRIDEAENVLRDLIKQDDMLAEPHWLLGAVLFAKDDLSQAALFFEQAIDLGFELSKKNNILFLIDIYAELEEYEKIVPLYELLIQREPDSADWYARLAAVYVAIGNEDKVVEYIYKAVEIDPSLVEEAKAFLEQNNIKL